MARKLVLGTAAALASGMGMGLAAPAFAQQGQSTRVTVSEQSFDRVDVNADGSVSLTEFRSIVRGADDPEGVFDQVDVNDDDEVGRGEWDRWRAEETAATTPGATLESGKLNRQIEAAVTTETLRAEFSTDAGLIGLEGNRLGAGLLFSDDNDIVLSGQLMAPGVLDQINIVPDYLTLSIGGKAMIGLLADPDSDVFSLMPGAEARWLIPLFGLNTWAVGNIFYAPDILTFGDADDVLDFSANYEVQFLPQTTAFAGYHVLRFDRDSGEEEIVNGLQIGVRFTF